MRMFFFAVLFLGSSLLACSQNQKSRKVPALVNNTLIAKFPDAIEVKWHHQQNIYKAYFKLALTEYCALIDATGHLVMYKNDVTGYELPYAIHQVLQTNYRTYLVEDLERIEKAGKVYYQVALEKNNQPLKQVFTPDGQSFKNQKYWE